MAESICASDAPPSTPTLATMAVAAGAAVLAGAMLGRKGLAGIAAGVAALAGAKWYSGARSDAHSPLSEDTTAVVDLSPEVHPPIVECADWLDHDAVDFSHMVPDSVQAAEMLKEKTLPLLDDDGQPVDFTAVPVDSVILDTVPSDYPNLPEPQFSLGPIIWKPGRFPQSASAGTSETVWFGMQDVTPAPPPLPANPLHPAAPPAQVPLQHAAPHAPVISQPAPPPLAAQITVPDAAVPAPPVPDPAFVPISVGLADITHPKQGSAPPPQNPFLAPVALQPEPVPAAFHAPLPATAPPEATAIPFATGAFGGTPLSFMAAADAAAAPVVTARPAAKSCLPQPRRAGELPKHMACRPPHSDPAAPVPPFSHQTPSWRVGAHLAQDQLCVEPQSPPQRHLERLAPVSLEPEEQRWPLLLLLCLILAIGVAIAADRWQDGALLRKVEALPWFQKTAEVNHKPAPPSASTPTSTPEPVKRGTWIEPAPGPGPVK